MDYAAVRELRRLAWYQVIATSTRKAAPAQGHLLCPPPGGHEGGMRQGGPAAGCEVDTARGRVT